MDKTAILKEALRDLTDSAFALASLADCGSPDSRGSEGAQFLKSVRSGVVDFLTDKAEAFDAAVEADDLSGLGRST